ncbi:hypothetical protein ACFWFX_22970 [Streptomyces roseolus]|uniref:nSTAND1 domain-containing NTPase n=1 Tax=Streptomyces roseolus TaxID=67358 RepID=UPI00364CA1B8
MGAVGRQEKPIDPGAGPEAEFALELRALRVRAGSPTYAAMARRAGAYSVATLSRAAAGEQLPTRQVLLAYVAACGGDAAEWEARWERVSAEVAARAAEADGESAPYRGLARFEPADRAVFFGRERLVDDLAALVQAHRVVTVIGPSGCGKSSLLRAGLVPRLQDGQEIPATIRMLVPGEQPFTRHERVLRAAGSEGETWLIVDQFEEVFTLGADERERTRFVDRLLEAEDPDSRLRVVLAVRADFYGYLLEHAGLASVVRRASLPVGPMSRDEVRRAITGPAAARSVVVERALTERIMDEVLEGGAGLPLLSHVLLETWRRRRARTLSVAAYESAGGIYGAIARSAEAAYGRLDPVQAAGARRIMLRLVRPGRDGMPDTRRPARRGELDPATTGTTLDALVRGRLVTVDADTVEIAHEALITAWPRLHGWVEESREQLGRHWRLTEAARAWEEHGRAPASLASDALLSAFGDLTAPSRSGELSRSEASFIAASMRARHLRRRRRTTVRSALAVLTTAAVLAGVTAWQQRLAGQEARTRSAALSAAALAEGLSVSDPREAGRLAIAAWSLSPTPQSRSALLGQYTHRYLPDFSATGEPTRGQYARLGPRGDSLLLQTHDRIEVWDIATGRRTASHVLAGLSRDSQPHHRMELDRFDSVLPQLSPDGRHAVAVAGMRDAEVTGSAAPARIDVWDLGSGARRTFTAGTVNHLPRVSWAPDSRTLLLDLGGAVELWDTETTRKVLSVQGAFTGAAPVLNADGSKLALCGPDGRVSVWDVQARRLAQRGSQDARPDTESECRSGSVQFTPDGHTLAVGTGAGIEYFRENVSGYRQIPGVVAFAFSANSKYLATATRDTLSLWRFDLPRSVDEQPMLTLPLRGMPVSDMRFDTHAGTLRYLDGGTVVRSLYLKDMLEADWQDWGNASGYLSPDGRHLISGRRKGSSYDFTMRDLEGARRTIRLPSLEPADLPRSPAPVFGTFSSDGQLFAYGSVAGEEPTRAVRLWDVRRGRALGVVRPPSAVPLMANFAVTGTSSRPVLYGATADALWDLARGRRVAELPEPLEGRYQEHPHGTELSVTSDGRTAVSATGTVFRLSDGQRTGTTTPRGTDSVMAFSPGDRYFAVSDREGRIALWEGTLRRQVGVLDSDPGYAAHGAPSRITSLAFAPDGHTLASGDSLGRIRLWDLDTLNPVGNPLRSPGDTVRGLAFSPDGRHLYSKGDNTPVRTHTLDPGAIVAQLCSVLGRGLTQDEWRVRISDVPFRETC